MLRKMLDALIEHQEELLILRESLEKTLRSLDETIHLLLSETVEIAREEEVEKEERESE